jgi:hypothetical protein
MLCGLVPIIGLLELTDVKHDLSGNGADHGASPHESCLLPGSLPFLQKYPDTAQGAQSRIDKSQRRKFDYLNSKVRSHPFNIGDSFLARCATIQGHVHQVKLMFESLNYPTDGETTGCYEITTARLTHLSRWTHKETIHTFA